MVETELKCTLRDLVAPELTEQALYITYLETTGNYGLKMRLVHLLSIFHGLTGENLHQHTSRLERLKS